MPEPVVLFRPALMAPSDPDTDPKTEIPSVDSGSKPVSENPAAAGKRQRSTPRALIGVAVGGLRAVARYPRVSLAVGLSVPILAVTLVYRPGKGDNAPPTVAIRSQSSSAPAAGAGSSAPSPSPSPSPPSPSATTASTKSQDPTPSAQPLTQADAPLLADDKGKERDKKADTEPGEGPLLASTLAKQDKPGLPPKAEADPPLEVEPSSPPPSSPVSSPISRSTTTEPAPAPPPDLQAGPSLLGSTLPDPAPTLPERVEPGGAPAIVGLTPIGAASPSAPTVPGSADAPSLTPVQAPEPLKLAVADVDPLLPESKLEQVSGDAKSVSPSGASTTPSAPKPSPNPSLVPDPVPVSPANPSTTPPASHDIPELKPPVPKPSPSPVVAPVTVPAPVPGPSSSLASSPSVQAATDPKQSDPKPGLPVKHPDDNLSPKSDPLPTTVPKRDEPTPAAEAATSVAGASLPSAPDVPPTNAPVASETVVKAHVAAPPPVATPVAAAVAAPVPMPVRAKEGPRTAEALKSAGWVELPSIGKLSLGREQDVDSVDADAPASGTGAGSGSEQAPRPFPRCREFWGRIVAAAAPRPGEWRGRASWGRAVHRWLGFGCGPGSQLWIFASRIQLARGRKGGKLLVDLSPLL